MTNDNTSTADFSNLGGFLAGFAEITSWEVFSYIDLVSKMCIFGSGALKMSQLIQSANHRGVKSSPKIDLLLPRIKFLRVSCVGRMSNQISHILYI